MEALITFYEKKKKINLRDNYKRTVLFYSLCHNSYDMVDYLLSNGADTLLLDAKGRSVLHYACILNCDKRIVQLLIDYNSEMDKYKAHTKEAVGEFKERPIKNYDCVPLFNHNSKEAKS
jgi:ankyrin repeat protein